MAKTNSTLSFALLEPNSTLNISSVYVLGSTRKSARATISQAREYNITVMLEGIGDVSSDDEPSKERLRQAIAKLPAGTNITATKLRTARTTQRIEYTRLPDRDSTHYENGSRHQCWCGHMVGGVRKLSEADERALVTDMLAHGDIRRAMNDFGISYQLVHATMKRYGYVRIDRVARAIKVA